MSELLGGGLMPGHQLGERDMLLAYLERQRELVFWKCLGLDDEAARTVSTPSGMTVAGIVQHLENVERSWWRKHFAGQLGLTFDWTDDPEDAGMTVAPGVSLSDLLSRYRAEIARCDEVIAAHQLDDIGALRDHSLRWILLHLVEEIGRHLGHLDLLCELADGRIGEEPEGAPHPGVDA
ncbi:MAG TPA: DinB family protein [Mycobacteriales bacterium]|nr:DinB family protein [Mycobacteriales bacterium]